MYLSLFINCVCYINGLNIQTIHVSAIKAKQNQPTLSPIFFSSFCLSSPSPSQTFKKNFPYCVSIFLPFTPQFPPNLTVTLIIPSKHLSLSHCHDAKFHGEFSSLILFDTVEHSFFEALSWLAFRPQPAPGFLPSSSASFWSSFFCRFYATLSGLSELVNQKNSLLTPFYILSLGALLPATAPVLTNPQTPISPVFTYKWIQTHFSNSLYDILTWIFQRHIKVMEKDPFHLTLILKSGLFFPYLTEKYQHLSGEETQVSSLTSLFYIPDLNHCQVSLKTSPIYFSPQQVLLWVILTSEMHSYHSHQTGLLASDFYLYPLSFTLHSTVRVIYLKSLHLLSIALNISQNCNTVWPLFTSLVSPYITLPSLCSLSATEQAEFLALSCFPLLRGLAFSRPPPASLPHHSSFHVLLNWNQCSHYILSGYHAPFLGNVLIIVSILCLHGRFMFNTCKDRTTSVICFQFILTCTSGPDMQ